jgi:uncharacterized protein (DUF58 family)
VRHDVAGARGGPESGAADPFPPAFLRLLAAVPALVRRTRVGAAAGVHASRGPGGPFLFRAHREYRPGDDLRRVDWRVLARHDRVVVREFEAERDARTEVILDGSASTAPFGGRAALLRACALAAATGLAGGGRVRIVVVADGDASDLCDADGLGSLPAMLDALRSVVTHGGARWDDVLPRLASRASARSRVFFASDLLTDAEPGLLHRFAGRGLSGAILHLRVAEIWSPPTEGLWDAVDAETGARRTIRWTPARSAAVAARAAAHAERWARHAHEVGLAYLPFHAGGEAESLLPLARRIALEVP